MTTRANGLLIALSVSWVLIAVCLALPQNHAAEDARYLQRQWGGLGLGAHTAPTSCFFVFDPRIEPYCPNLERPLPALPTFCPRHGTTVAHFPAMRAYRANTHPARCSRVT